MGVVIFVAGMIVGAMMGIAAMCLMITASEADKGKEILMNKERENEAH